MRTGVQVVVGREHRGVAADDRSPRNGRRGRAAPGSARRRGRPPQPATEPADRASAAHRAPASAVDGDAHGQGCATARRASRGRAPERRWLRSAPPDGTLATHRVRERDGVPSRRERPALPRRARHPRRRSARPAGARGPRSGVGRRRRTPTVSASPTCSPARSPPTATSDRPAVTARRPDSGQPVPRRSDRAGAAGPTASQASSAPRHRATLESREAGHHRQEPRAPGGMHVISRTREQTTAAEPPPDPAADGADLDRELPTSPPSRRSTSGTRPTSTRSDEYRPALAAAARSHRRLADHRAPGQELIRISPAGRTSDAAGRAVARRARRRAPPPRRRRPSRSSPTTCPTSSSRCSPRCAGPGARSAGSSIPSSSWSARPTATLRDVLPDADPAAPPPGALAESWIHLDLVGPSPAGLEADLAEVLREVREVVQDAPAMARQAVGLADRLLADGLLGTERAGAADASPAPRRREPAALARRRALHLPRPPLPHRRPRPARRRGPRAGGAAARPRPRRGADPDAAGPIPPRRRSARPARVHPGQREEPRAAPGAALLPGGLRRRRHRPGRRRAPVPRACSPSPRCTRTCSTSPSWSGTCAPRSTAPGSRWSPTPGSGCSR